MSPTPDFAMLAAVALPLLGAVLAPLLHRLTGVSVGWLLALLPAATVLLLAPLVVPVAEGQTFAAIVGWAPSAGLEFALRLDGLSLTFSLTIAAIGTFILIYAASYLHGHPHRGRFLSFLLLFMGAMQGLVLADNLIALYLFWELTSVTSFLLIGFDHARQGARRAAIQALVVTGFGGLALLAGGVIIHALSGSWTLSGIGIDLRDSAAYPLLVVLMLLAAFTKSAQVPFHFWLPNAMEAPTPVSAYLHSATMVQAGVYLVARLTPELGGEALWNGSLMLFGGLTLLWGAVGAMRQTDLKQMLAQTTLASLGLLMLLIGIGSETALLAAALYFLAHALYKAALFLVAGAIDHGTGTRDITVLAGLRRSMPLTFAAALLAAFSMFGLPPALGFFAKEEIYLAVTGGDGTSLLALVALVVGNALLGAVALAVALRPFLGLPKPTPLVPHEAGVSLLAGPMVFGVLGLVLGLMPGWVGDSVVAPMAAAIGGVLVESHLKLAIDLLHPAFWLSLLTWGLAVAGYVWLDRLRRFLLRIAAAVGWDFDRGFDQLYFGLVRTAGWLTRLLHHGRLERYLLVLFAMLALAAIAPLWLLGGLPRWPAWPALTFYEWSVVLLAAGGVAIVVFARNRLFAILALGVQGLAVALLYMLFGAPDLSFTQFMVEILSVVILALVMTRLRLDAEDPRPLEDLLRDGGLAVVAGLGITTLLFAVLQQDFDTRLGDFFTASSVALAHGRNVVNVIIVDFRGLDTLGEISVLMTAGIGIVALIRSAKRRTPADPEATPPTQRERGEAGA